MVEQPTLFDVGAEAPHVDEYAPGLLNPEQWGARSDVYHHSSVNEEWMPGRGKTSDVHVGTEKAAVDRSRGSERPLHQLRLTNPADIDPIDDIDANGAVLSRWKAVDKGYESPLAAENNSLFSRKRPDAAAVMDEPDIALPYSNTAEDYGSVSYIARQQGVRTWAQDVGDQAASGGKAPSGFMQGLASAVGNRAMKKTPRATEGPWAREDDTKQDPLMLPNQNFNARKRSLDFWEAV